MAAWAATILGGALFALVLRDLYATLFQPQALGAPSAVLHRVIWRGVRRGARHPKDLAAAGPLAMVATIAAWLAVAAVGWAFVLWPRVPGGFLLAPGLDADEQGGFLDALYVSTVTLATLGYGDLTPRSAPLRLLLPAEALVGFALLTGSITWVLSVASALARRRMFARQVSQLEETAGWRRSARPPTSRCWPSWRLRSAGSAPT